MHTHFSLNTSREKTPWET